ncbi:MAG TPA: HD domain-containing phosphohydrolase [Anaerolineales bacterium]|nr:HD domain-containing phosphohydrolase [Anaerolineales bacterium]
MFPDPEATEKHNKQLARLVELSVTLNSTLDLDALLQLITTTATDLLDCEAASILLYDERQSRLYFAAATGSDPRELAEIPVPLDRSLAGTIFRTNQSIILNDVTHDTRHFTGVSKQVGFRVRSLVGVPMLAKGRVIGVLEGINKREGEFSESDKAILSVTASHAATAINNARLFRDAERRARNLDAIRYINNAVLNNPELQITLPQILSHLRARLEVDAADVLLLDPHLNALTFAAGLGFRTKALNQAVLRLGEGIAGRVALEKKIVNIPDIKLAGEIFTRGPFIKEEEFVAYHAAPLIVKGNIKGVLEVFHRAPLGGDLDWMEFFQTLAEQTAIAIDSATLFTDLQRSHQDLKLAYDATILGWAHALDLRDKETQGHTQRVTRMTVQLARAFGLGEEEITHIQRGALLHDMGKIGVPDAVLHKPSQLTDEEWFQMRRHPQYAYEMLEEIDYLRPALDIPYCHHEKWDGTGYPRGLKGEEIPLAARLFSVVDVWDALYYDRPYRKGWDLNRTLEYIREQSGKHFDPSVVEVFLRVVQEIM